MFAVPMFDGLTTIYIYIYYNQTCCDTTWHQIGSIDREDPDYFNISQAGESIKS